MRLRLRPSDRRQGRSGRSRLREGGSRPGSLEDSFRQAERWFASLPQSQREFFFDTLFDEQLAPFPNG